MLERPIFGSDVSDYGADMSADPRAVESGETDRLDGPVTQAH